MAASKKLKAFQFEQYHSSRNAQIEKEQSLKSLGKSLTVWLNFLLESPASCGCDLSIAGVQVADASPATRGKRDNVSRNSVGVDSSWRTPKRQRKTVACSSRVGKEIVSNADSQSSSFSRLKDSLKDVCSFDDFKQRMSVYLSLGACEDIFQVMNQVTRTIDEGRINMKAHCPIVTDFGLKDKAVKVLMCYNPSWLRIGLYIIFGGDSLVSNGDGESDQDAIFLKMVIDKLFFTHEGLAKAYAYNKMVEGVYMVELSPRKTTLMKILAGKHMVGAEILLIWVDLGVKTLVALKKLSMKRNLRKYLGMNQEKQSDEETRKKKGTQGIIEIENPNLVKPNNLKARDVDVEKTSELSRCERIPSSLLFVERR